MSVTYGRPLPGDLCLSLLAVLAVHELRHFVLIAYEDERLTTASTGRRFDVRLRNGELHDVREALIHCRHLRCGMSM